MAARRPDVYDAPAHLPAYVVARGDVAFVLLLPLYLSQRRDLERLRAWMEREPGHPAADLAASEALLDRAEAELEAVLGAKPARRARPDAGGQAPQRSRPWSRPRRRRRHPGARPLRAGASGSPPSARPWSGSRWSAPPCSRIRAGAGSCGRVGQPRVLGRVAAAAVVLGLAAIFGSERLLGAARSRGTGPRPGRSSRATSRSRCSTEPRSRGWRERSATTCR